MWAAGLKYSWKKMEVGAQDRAGWKRVVSGRVPMGVTRHK